MNNFFIRVCIFLYYLVQNLKLSVMSDRKKYVFYERSKKKRSVISEKVQLITTLGCVLLILGTVAAIASSGGFGGLESLPSASGPHKPKPKPTKPHASTPAAPEKPAPEIFNISLGTIRGVFSKSMKGRKFLSFKGVPYAVAPLGNSRFKVSSYQRKLDQNLSPVFFNFTRFSASTGNDFISLVFKILRRLKRR